MSKRNRKSSNVANVENVASSNVVTLSHDATNVDATREQSTFTNNVASTQTTRVERVDTSKIAHHKNDRMTREQIDANIDALLYELHTLQNDDNDKHRNEQKRVRRALRSFDYYISKTNVIEHNARVARVIASRQQTTTTT